MYLYTQLESIQGGFFLGECAQRASMLDFTCLHTCSHDVHAVGFQCSPSVQNLKLATVMGHQTLYNMCFKPWKRFLECGLALMHDGRPQNGIGALC